MTPGMYVVTPVHHRHHHLRRLISGLNRSTRPPDAHVVVAMDDPAVAAVAPHAVVVDVHRNGHALPLAAARNQGVAAASGAAHPDDLLIFLDVDCIPVPELVEAYRQAALARPDDLLCGPVAYLPDVELTEEQYRTEYLAQLAEPHPARPAPEPGDIITGGRHELFWSLSFALRREVWERIGGFDENYCGYGGEDTDFALAARAAGVGLSWVGAARAFHQYHPVSSPPVEHLDDILRNGRVFADKWGWWPMQGWLAQFQDAGLITAEHEIVPLTVASVPASHVYIRHLAPLEQPDVPTVQPPVVRLPDPPPTREPAPTGAPWWPPAMLDPQWIRTHEFDLFHLHFGFDAYSAADLAAIVETLRATRKPLVYTVHDVHNPHHQNSDLHDSHLDVLIPAADAVITLTTHAADSIRHRWNVDAHVIPHPHVVDLETMLRFAVTPLRSPQEFRVGVHLKSLRANMAALPVLEATLAGVHTIEGGVLQVNIHQDVFDDDGARHDPAVVAWLHTQYDRGHLDLRVHDYFTDTELYEYLSRLHVSVLPYRFGTHSGWLETCHDLGTQVIAPNVGCYESQGADHIYRWDNPAVNGPVAEAVVNVASMQQALHSAAAESGRQLRAQHRAPRTEQDHYRAAQAKVRARLNQREQISQAHTRVYRQVLLRSRTSPTAR